jgi:hypothetical protein
MITPKDVSFLFSDNIKCAGAHLTHVQALAVLRLPGSTVIMAPPVIIRVTPVAPADVADPSSAGPLAAPSSTKNIDSTAAAAAAHAAAGTTTTQRLANATQVVFLLPALLRLDVAVLVPRPPQSVAPWALSAVASLSVSSSHSELCLLFIASMCAVAFAKEAEAAKVAAAAAAAATAVAAAAAEIVDDVDTMEGVKYTLHGNGIMPLAHHHAAAATRTAASLCNVSPLSRADTNARLRPFYCSRANQLKSGLSHALHLASQDLSRSGPQKARVASHWHAFSSTPSLTLSISCLQR